MQPEHHVTVGRSIWSGLDASDACAVTRHILLHTLNTHTTRAAATRASAARPARCARPGRALAARLRPCGAPSPHARRCGAPLSARSVPPQWRHRRSRRGRRRRRRRPPRPAARRRVARRSCRSRSSPATRERRSGGPQTALPYYPTFCYPTLLPLPSCYPVAERGQGEQGQGEQGQERGQQQRDGPAGGEEGGGGDGCRAGDGLQMDSAALADMLAKKRVS